MNKITAFLMVLLLCGLSACGERQSAEEPLAVYSFSGENEFFSLSDGVLALSEATDALSCGRLKPKQNPPDGIVSYTEELYLVADGKQKTLSSSSMTDLTGGSVKLGDGLARRVGKDMIMEDRDSLNEHPLYFELTTTNRNGEQTTYQIQLDVTKIV